MGLEQENHNICKKEIETICLGKRIKYREGRKSWRFQEENTDKI